MMRFAKRTWADEHRGMRKQQFTRAWALTVIIITAAAHMRCSSFRRFVWKSRRKVDNNNKAGRRFLYVSRSIYAQHVRAAITHISVGIIKQSHMCAHI